MIAAMVVAPSYLSRITGEVTTRLDDIELGLRRRANSFAYTSFSALALLGISYLGIADSTESVSLWRPTEFDHWKAIFWGAFLYACILPVAYLAWIVPAPRQEEIS